MQKNERINKERKEVELSVGDPVFYKIHLRENSAKHLHGNEDTLAVILSF